MAQPLAAPYSQFFDANGVPLNGGKIYTYAAGTTTPKDSYTDYSGTTPTTNPVVLDSAGRATIWLSGNYKIVVKDSAGNTLVTTDNLTASSSPGDMNSSIYDPANIQEQVVGLTAVQTLTNKTMTNSIVGNQSPDDDSTKAASTAYVARALNEFSLTASVGSSALTIALKTRSGADPSSTNPVAISFRNSTASTGDYTQLAVTAATSLVVSSGSTLGTSNSIAFRAWLIAFNDGGTFRLGIVNCLTSTGIFSLDEGTLLSSTAEGGAGAADSAGVAYTGTAVTSKAFRILGYVQYNSGLGTAGTWSAVPDVIQVYQPGIKKPGEVVQRKYSETGAVQTGTTTIPYDDTIPTITEGDEYMTLAITPKNTCNLLSISAKANLAHSATSRMIGAMFQDATSAAIAVRSHFVGTTNEIGPVNVEHTMLAGTTSSTTFRLRAGSSGAGTTSFNGASASREFGGVLLSSMEIIETQG